MSWTVPEQIKLTTPHRTEIVREPGTGHLRPDPVARSLIAAAVRGRTRVLGSTRVLLMCPAYRYGSCAVRASRRLSRKVFTRRAVAKSGMTAPRTT
ncbi:hypothetical protein SAMN02787144_1005243 [Streptomyces atratus]|uniref:Uncharacterized protein n=1 Tax=Streptomyces atratus TaxID=1893 RepID=A0A1K1Z9N1_STRAR|nr:hypothetical protein SAMN02787144_1005243 [Streptomyces atratus]